MSTGNLFFLHRNCILIIYVFLIYFLFIYFLLFSFTLFLIILILFLFSSLSSFILFFLFYFISDFLSFYPNNEKTVAIINTCYFGKIYSYQSILRNGYFSCFSSQGNIPEAKRWQGTFFRKKIKILFIYFFFIKNRKLRNWIFLHHFKTFCYL